MATVVPKNKVLKVLKTSEAFLACISEILFKFVIPFRAVIDHDKNQCISLQRAEVSSLYLMRLCLV